MSRASDVLKSWEKGDTQQDLADICETLDWEPGRVQEMGNTCYLFDDGSRVELTWCGGAVYFYDERGSCIAQRKVI